MINEGCAAIDDLRQDLGDDVDFESAQATQRSGCILPTLSTIRAPNDEKSFIPFANALARHETHGVNCTHDI